VQREDVALEDHFEIALDPAPADPTEVEDELEVQYQDLDSENALLGCALTLGLAIRDDGVVSDYTPVLQVVDVAAEPSLTPTAASPTPSRTPTVTTTPTEAGTSTPTTTPAGPTPSPTVPPDFNRVFVTSTLQSGNLGGLAGADAICAARAAAAGLPGTYVAWLSTPSENAASRLGNARGFVRIDGQPFANTISDIISQRIFNPLRIDEGGADVTGGQSPSADTVTVWTGTSTDGLAAAATCNNWISASSADDGFTGRAAGGSASWTARSNGGCDIARRLYCFQTDHTGVDLVPPPTSGKIAFVSTKTFTPGAGVGIAGADTLCASNAAGAGLSGTYKALLATTTTSAASRMTLAPLYVRPDGIPIATGVTIGAGGSLDSGIWQRADGSYVAVTGDLTFTGASTPSATGTLASTCSDWTSTASTSAAVGADTLADPTWWNIASNGSCTLTLAVYCLEE
jgi:hypothetical protein